MKEYYKGTIEVNAGGTLSPGNSIGKLYLTGDFNLSNAGTLLMEIGGADLDSNDYLQVTGDLNLTDGSVIYLDMSDTSTLAMGETFTLNLTASNSSEFTSDFISKYVRSYYFTDLQYSQLSDGSYAITGRIDPNAVPEPSTWALLLLGVMGFYWLRNQHKTRSKNVNL